MTSTLIAQSEPTLESPSAAAAPISSNDPRTIVLVATDGTAGSDGALRIAAERARATGAELHVMIVLEAELHMSSNDGHFGESRILHRRAARRRAVEEQLGRVLGPEHLHVISVYDGNPALAISRVAMERRSSLIVVGIGRHNAADRIFSDETALQLARIARTPVLAVPADAASAPRHAVVAIDFSDISTRAAQSAVETVADGGRVDLVHVMPNIGEDAFTVEAEEPYARWVGEQLAALGEALVVPAGVTVTTVALRGQRSPQLLAYAARVAADLICTGTHGRGFVGRALLGSVTTALMRGATSTILTVPRDPLPAVAVAPQAAA